MSNFMHRKCGGRLYVDIAGMISLKTQSVAIGSEGIYLGVFEMQAKEGEPVFCCSKCKRELNPSNSSEITSSCLTCRKNKPVDELYSCTEIPVICESCSQMITGSKEPDDSMKETLKFLTLPKGKNLVFKKLSEMLKTISLAERRL